ncbi:AAA family ATPase [Hyphomicrobium sp. MC8b]|uniref:AAA family ATPase n=1 Tax=Hyphomicrobium sp. MC8b TaxID=300273 RepID=UPI00391CDB62
MRPVRLTMQAFGPFPGRIVIDFRHAVDAGLFGIYGQTGSGKSTIFSAMTFALFGAPAKPDQDAPSLRSDLADAATITEVEFVFDIGRHRYVIVRRPDQMRPKQRGDGETRSSHEAFLFEASGIALDQITERHRGKIVAEKKVGKVDAAIVEMLGYGAEQFRQIVLLPQGRFETFLAAKTKERLEILRELFDVTLYRDLAARLKTEADAAERHVRGEREVCARRLNHEGFESTDALAVGIREAETRHAELIEVETTASGLSAAASTAWREAEMVEGQFKAADDSATALAALLDSSAGIESLSERVDKAERARFLLDAEGLVSTAAGDVRIALETLTRTQQAMTVTAERAKAAQDALDTEKTRAPEIEKLHRELDDLSRYRGILSSAESIQSALGTSETAERGAASALEDAQKYLAVLHDDRGRKADSLKSARMADGQRRDISVRIASLKSLVSAAETFETVDSGVQSAQMDLKRLTIAHDDAKRQVETAHAIFEEAERRLSASQALHLASKLAPDAPCPVCGATEHPAPATRAPEHVESDAEFRAAKDALQKAEKAAQEVAQKHSASMSILREREDRLAELDRPEQSAATFAAMLLNAERELGKLGPEIDIARSEADLDALDSEISACEKDRDALREALDEKKTKKIEARARLDESLAAVPLSLRSDDAIAAAETTASVKLTTLETAKTTAEQIAMTARDAAFGARKDQEAAENALTKARERHGQAIEAFQSRLARTGLTEDVYLELKPSFDTIDSDRQTIKAHHDNLAIAKHSVETTAEAVSQKVRPDLPSVEAERLRAEDGLNKAKDERLSAKGRLGQLQKLQGELADIFRKLDEDEAATGPLRNLAVLFNGDNPQKLDLETFAIGAMFDQVLQAANLRIGPMTNNRYLLERDLENGRGRRGLGIQVFDSHTGKARPTSTLSGGETFISALALALGLADVVESASGKIRLDTIFIDEGFGSLDTENGSGTLDQVLQVLGTLVSQNRAVGIISHVPLVQEAIPNGFYVRKNLTGSTVETRQLT